MIAIKNAKVVLENGILFDGVVLVEEDKIVAVGDAMEIEIPADAQIVDAAGAYVGPGFVDLHNHGGNGRFFYADPETAARHFLNQGTTTVLATLYYDLSKQDFIDSIRRVKNAMENGVAGKAIGGLYMEGPYMNPKYGASPEKNKWRGPIAREDYQDIIDEAGDLAKVWAIAPEREGIEEFIKDAKKVNPSAMISVGHSEATPAQVAKLKKYGLNLQTHCTNATGRVNERGGIRSAGPDEACMTDKDMYAEIICDSCAIHVHKDTLQMIQSIKGIERMVLITDSYVSDGKSPEHLQHIEDLVFDDKSRLTGSKLTMNIACRNVMRHSNIGICQAFLMASRNPARVIGMDNEVGSIEAGKRANLVFVDDMFHVEKVMLNGQFVDRD